MIIYFAFIAIKIKVIDNINLAVLFSGMQCYGVALFINSSVVWNPVGIASRWIFYINAQNAVIVFNSQKLDKGSIALYFKARLFSFFFGNPDITFVTYKEFNTMERFKNKLLFIVVIHILNILFALSKKNTNVNAKKIGDLRKQSNIRVSYATFPLGNGLWGNA